MDGRRLSIPIYLNQRIVFDLLAMVEGGFSQLQSVKTTQADSQSAGIDATAEVGMKNVFAFLNLGVKGSGSKASSKSSQHFVEEERVFTPASLFSRLRDALTEQKLLMPADRNGFDSLEPGSFVEFSGVLRKNPMVSYMESIVEIFEMGLFLQGFDVEQGSQGKGKKQEKSTLAQMKKFAAMLTQGGSLDLVADVIGSNLKVIVPVQLKYFSDESPANIIDGQFVVLGKIVRLFPKNDNQSISLLRTTPLAHMPEEALAELVTAFTDIGSEMKTLGEFTTHISAPVMQIVPIAIYA